MGYELHKLSASYDGIPVLDSISLNLPAESITVVFGPSGCGKTTLLNLIAGLKKPDSGLRTGFESTRFSYAFQEPRLLAWLSARDNAAFALSGALARKEALLRIDKFMAAAGLSDSAGRRPSELSGGMRQRLSLVRAFAYPAELLLLDEAFQAVDLRMKLELMDTFLELWREERKTAILVTHDIEEAVYLADSVVVLSERPARVIEHFPVTVPRGSRVLGSAATMEAEAKLYQLVLRGG